MKISISNLRLRFWLAMFRARADQGTQAMVIYAILAVTVLIIVMMVSTS